MNNFLLNLLKISAATTLIYLTYLLLFSKDTFYLRNRILLILTLILPTIIPVIRIPFTVYRDVPADNINTPVNLLPATSGQIPSIPFDYVKLFEWIYLAVAGFLFIRVIFSVISTYKIIKKGAIRENQFPKVVISDSHHPPFSFFPYAVIPSEDFKNENYRDILNHEFAHIRQGHTLDLILSEIFIAFQWFNPFIWFIKRSIILNHEYLADRISLKNKNNSKEYQYRLLNISGELKHISLAHNFNSLIKNRIIMINKKPTNRYAALKNFLVLPVVAIVGYAFASPEYHYVNPVNVSISSTSPMIAKMGKDSEYKTTISTEQKSALQDSTKFRKYSSKEEPFTICEEMPMYLGGETELLNFIKNNIIYPEEAKTQNIQGKVIVRFVVSTEGNAEDITVLKGVPLLNEEAKRVCSLLKKFIPGRQGGKPVNVYYMVPVAFTLPVPEQPK